MNRLARGVETCGDYHRLPGEEKARLGRCGRFVTEWWTLVELNPVKYTGVNNWPTIRSVGPSPLVHLNVGTMGYR